MLQLIMCIAHPVESNGIEFHVDFNIFSVYDMRVRCDMALVDAL